MDDQTGRCSTLPSGRRTSCAAHRIAAGSPYVMPVEPPIVQVAGPITTGPFVGPVAGSVRRFLHRASTLNVHCALGPVFVGEAADRSTASSQAAAPPQIGSTPGTCPVRSRPGSRMLPRSSLSSPTR